MMQDQQVFSVEKGALAAKDVITAFLKAMKSYDLYPHDHALALKFLKGIHSLLESFLYRFGELKIVIEQDRLLYESIPVYEAKLGEDNFAFLLYRDGLLWIEFRPGLTINEIKIFFSIINQYRILTDEPEDDIVTALWDEDMVHIKYEAKEIFFENVPLLDFSTLNKALPADSDECELEETDNRISLETENILTMVSGGQHLESWGLSIAENEKLQEMVLEAEQSVRKGDVLQVLFFVLTKQDNADDFAIVLSFLEEEWRSEIEAGNFSQVLLYLTALKKQREFPPPGREWLAELLAEFFDDISGEKVLASLSPVIAHLDGEDPIQLTKFKKLLLLLEPRAIFSLINLLSLVKKQKVLDVLFTVLVKLGHRDISCLRELQVSENDRIALGAVQVLSMLDGREPARLITESLEHGAAKVRRVALESYLVTGKPSLDKIFKFIDDPDVMIRALLLSFLGRERNKKVEKMLLDYLVDGSLQHLDESHVNACYRALGRCGSMRSLPFLEKTLLGLDWQSLIKGSGSVWKHGAVTALLELQLKEATAILEHGATSLVPDIRKSCRNALTKNSDGVP